MNHHEKFVAALDLGTSKIIALVGRKVEGEPMEIVAASAVPSMGIKRGVVLNVEEAVRAIRQAISQVEKTIDQEISQVYVGIGGQFIRSFRNKVYRFVENNEEITATDVEELYKDNFKLRFEGNEEIIQVIPQSYTVDNESGVTNPVGMPGNKIEGIYHIVAGKTLLSKNIQKSLERAGLKLAGLFFSPLATADGVITKEEREVGVVLVDIGAGTTDLAVYYDGIMRHAAIIPFGGSVVTSDIKEGCAILAAHAETLKVRYGSALALLADENKVVTIPGVNGWNGKEISFKTLSHIIQARMEEVLQNVLYQIELSGYIDRLGAGIVITGGTANLLNIQQLIKVCTGLETRIGCPRNITTQLEELDLKAPELSLGIGILLNAQESCIKTPSLEPVEPEEIPVEKEPVDTENNFDKELQGVEREERRHHGKKFMDRFVDKLMKVFDDKKDIEIN